jgi:hypothetical protein
MSNTFKASDVITWIDCKGKTDCERMESLYKKIGAYFTANAERMASDAIPTMAEINLNIAIRWDEVITINKEVKEYLMEVK